MDSVWSEECEIGTVENTVIDWWMVLTQSHSQSSHSHTVESEAVFIRLANALDKLLILLILLQLLLR